MTTAHQILPAQGQRASLELDEAYLQRVDRALLARKKAIPIGWIKSIVRSKKNFIWKCQRRDVPGPGGERIRVRQMLSNGATAINGHL